jgi:hypothetical protein
MRPLAMLDCRHVSSTPAAYATLRDGGAKICDECSASHDWIDALQTGRLFAYLATDGSITSWPGVAYGAAKAHVSAPRRVGFGRRIYVAWRGPDGWIWSGSGPADSGSYVRLRRTKTRWRKG